MDQTPQSPVRTLLYLDDLHVGQRFVSGSHRIDEEQIKAFAVQFDPQPFHLDAEAAKHSFFGGLVASGWHTGAITMRLLVQGGLPIAGGLIGAGGEISWPRPTHPGEVLHVGDHVEMDVLGAARAGLRTAWVHRDDARERHPAWPRDDITPDIKARANLSYAKGIAKTKGSIGVLSRVPVFSGNPFLPAAAQDAFTRTNTASAFYSRAAIAETGAKGPKDMGAVMKNLNAKIHGKAEGRAISEAVKAELA